MILPISSWGLTMLSTLLLSVFILVALVTFLRTKGALRLYVASAIFSSLLLLYGYGRPHYAIVYTVARIPEIAAMFWLARLRWAAVPGALGLALFAFLGLLWTTPSAQIICLSEGSLFTLAGLSLGIRVISKREAILAVAWLLVAAFDFSFAMGLELPNWQRLNEWWASVVYIAAFALVAILGNQIRYNSQSISA